MIKYYIQLIKEEISPQGFKTILTMWILFAFGIAGCEYAFADNEIYIIQSGEGTKLFVEQEGKDNADGNCADDGNPLVKEFLSNATALGESKLILSSLLFIYLTI